MPKRRVRAEHTRRGMLLLAHGAARVQAMAFAALGALLLAGRPGNVPSCTGATSHAMLGKVVPHAAGYGALVRKLAAVGLPV